MFLRVVLASLVVGIAGVSLAQPVPPESAAPVQVAPPDATAVETATDDTFSRLYVRALARYLTADEQTALRSVELRPRPAIAFESADRALREIAALALTAVGHDDAAGALRALAPIRDADTAAAAHAAAMELYPTIPFRRGHGLRVSAAESCLLSAMSAVRMLADASDKRDTRALRSVPDATVRDGLIATQVARAAGQALDTVADRAAVLAVALGLVGAGAAAPGQS